MALFSSLNTPTESQFTPSHVPTLDELIALEAAAAPAVITPREQPAGFGDLQPESEQTEQQWDRLTQEEGQLAIDVCETQSDIILISAIAGVKSQDLELTLQQDMLTIRGKRIAPAEILEGEPLVNECYWGGFSRTVILPSSVDPQSAQARLSSGVLVIRLRKLASAGSIPVFEEMEEEA
ncbi:Hsp20/alpha crystallin family protein [Candidatus Uhrbacteria bacterium]|nr:Hsp20/alpha crystallin family protein [Candidatus Uhrbacteria bacterium]